MTMISRQTLSAVAGAAAVAVAGLISGCGNSADSSSSSATSKSPPTKASANSASGAATVTLSADADGSLYFEPRTLTASSGRVTLVMSNPKTSGKSHGIAVEGNGVDKDGPIVKPGSRSTVTVALKPGRYSFYCPVRGHEAGGMKGTLTVQ